MRTLHTSVLAVAALAIAGCEMPMDGDAISAEDAASFDADGDSPRLQSAPGQPSVRGRLSGKLAIEVGDATVCVVDAAQCVITDDLGRFRVSGLEADVSEAIEIHADGYMPLIVPIELGGSDSIFLDLELVPQGAVRPKGGAVRFVSNRLDGYWQTQDVAAQWIINMGENARSRSVSGVNPVARDIPAGIYEAHFISKDPTMCGASTGWAGSNSNTLAFPVVAGAITHIEQNCLSLN